MNENDELKEMLKKIAFLDLIVGLALTVLVYYTFKGYLWICLVGFLMAIISFYINTYIIKYSVSNNTSNGKAFIMIGFILRVLLISALGVILYNYNRFNIIAYMFGFSFRFISLLMYGLINKK